MIKIKQIGGENKMKTINIGLETERYLAILRDKYESETGHEVTLDEALELVVKQAYKGV